jgi:P-type conjugative transfer protein TrbG
MHVIRSFKVSWLLVALLGLGCSSFPKAPRMGPEDYPNASAPLSRESASAAASEVPANPDVEYLDVDHPDLQEPMRQFLETGRPPVIRHKDRRYVRYPYGHSDPLLYCKPLRVCDLELQPGEQVLDVALGDTELWHADRMESGPAGLRTPHVIFKPKMDGIATNAVITTDRRVYHLGLVARVDETGLNRQRYVRHASFYYPNAMVTAWTSAQARQRLEQLAAVAAAAPPEPAIPPKLYYGYEISGDTVPWQPEEVFDDGTRVYIKMPTAMHVTESPGLWVIDEHGEQNLVNYRVRDGHYIVDKVFSKARMAVGVGSKADEVYITRQKPSEVAADSAEVEPSALAHAR